MEEDYEKIKRADAERCIASTKSALEDLKTKF